MLQYDDVAIKNLATNHGITGHMKGESARAVLDAVTRWVKRQTPVRLCKAVSWHACGNTPQKRDSVTLPNQLQTASTPFLPSHAAFPFKRRNMIGGRPRALVAEALANLPECGRRFPVRTPFLDKVEDKLLWCCEFGSHAKQLYSRWQKNPAQGQF